MNIHRASEQKHQHCSWEPDKFQILPEIPGFFLELHMKNFNSLKAPEWLFSLINERVLIIKKLVSKEK